MAPQSVIVHSDISKNISAVVSYFFIPFVSQQSFYPSNVKKTGSLPTVQSFTAFAMFIGVMQM